MSIRTEHLTHTYSQGTPFEKTAIRDVSIDIETGTFAGIIGHTGSGKSTLIQHLNGLLKPTSGRVFVDGEDIWARPKEIRRVRFAVGLVFQYPEYQLFEETVYKDIAFGPQNMGLDADEVDRRVKAAARFVGLGAEVMEKSPFELSGGQKRRAAIAGVLAMRPGVLILDEPTAGLDPRGRDRILGQIKEYHQEEKNTVLLVSHSMEDIAKFASKVLVMNQGGVYLYDEVEKVFSLGAAMTEMGLATPQVSTIFGRLAAMGYDVNPNVYTLPQAKKELMRILGKGAADHA